LTLNNIENIWFEIGKNNKKYIIGGIYRHLNQQIEDFKQQIDTVLSKLANQKYPSIIAGDINIDLTKCKDNKATAELVDTLLTNNLIPTIILLTRITLRTATLIDHIYYSGGTTNSDSTKIKTGNFVNDISDHLANYLLLLNYKKYQVAEQPMFRIFSTKNKEKFKYELKETNWSPVLKIGSKKEQVKVKVKASTKQTYKKLSKKVSHEAEAYGTVQL